MSYYVDTTLTILVVTVRVRHIFRHKSEKIIQKHRKLYKKANNYIKEHGSLLFLIASLLYY